MEFVGPTARGRIHDAAAAPPELGAVTVGLNAELLNRVRVGENIRDLRVRVLIDATIQVERCLVGAGSACRYKSHGRFRPRGPLRETSRSTRTHVGRQGHKLEYVAA